MRYAHEDISQSVLSHPSHMIINAVTKDKNKCMCALILWEKWNMYNTIKQLRHKFTMPKTENRIKNRTLCIVQIDSIHEMWPRPPKHTKTSTSSGKQIICDKTCSNIEPIFQFPFTVRPNKNGVSSIGKCNFLNARKRFVCHDQMTLGERQL